MGMGDELMAMGEARQLSEQYNGARVVIADKVGAPRWHEIWSDAPYIRQRGDHREGIGVRNGPGCRPYIERYDSERFWWRDYQPVPADLRHVGGWNESTRRAVVIEPNLKPSASVNKQWPRDLWLKLVADLGGAGYRVVQLGAPAWVLPGVEVVPTPDFRSLVRAMRNAAVYVGHEGGLHHLSAALHLPAVVIFGGYIWPRSTGYSTHHNLYAGGYACGARKACAHCAAAMESITVPMVRDAITGALNDERMARVIPA